ncbi:MAG: hypothetical protein PHQ27_06830 [Victivallales bacterium]|nr:hypothetical protein [Victivallales bacterium]
MRNIGGEMELRREDGYYHVTDSGRSSLRLILSSAAMTGKKCLLPDFICASVIAVFQSVGADYAFYHVNSDLTPDPDSIFSQDFDALYLIDYFGRRPELSGFTGRGLIVIEDGVFLPEIELNDSFAAWAGFNSFRKITPAADGSVVRSTFPLPTEKINLAAAPFAAVKYEGRHDKYDYFHHAVGTEEAFLEKLRCGEKIIDGQQEIYHLSDTGFLALTRFFRDFASECRLRCRNWRVVAEELSDYALPVTPDFPSVFVMATERRDELREYLFSRNIFLPIHWPAPDRLDHELYSRIISIPVDSRYDVAELLRVTTEIRDFLQS